MKKVKTKLIAALTLVLCLILSVVAAVVLIAAPESAIASADEVPRAAAEAPSGALNEEGKRLHDSTFGTADAHNGAKEITSAGGSLTSGNYFLSEDVDLNTRISISANETVNICLNGHKLNGTGAATTITVNSGATLNLFDCCVCADNSKGHLHYFTKNYPYDFSNGDTDYIIGGVITGGVGTYGGGMSVSGGATCNMYGGAIAGNSATGNSGGVSIGGGSVFNMYGGSVAGNSSGCAGGLYAAGTLNMYGGSVTDNRAGGAGGGGVYLSNAFNMYGGTISNNQTTYGSGAGVSVANSSKFTMTGGTITGNKAVSATGSGVHVGGSATFTMTGGEISENSATSNGGGVNLAGTMNLSGGTIKGNQAANGAGINLSGTLNMSGGTITENKTTSGNGAGIYLYYYATLNVEGSPQITGNSKSSAANNLYLSDIHCFIRVNAALDAGAQIGVSLVQDYGTATFTSGLNNRGSASNFISDDANYVVTLSSNEAKLAKPDEVVSSIPKVTANNTEITAVYNENAQTIKISNFDEGTMTAKTTAGASFDNTDFSATDVGTYYLNISLNDVTKTKWDDETTASVLFKITITPATVSMSGIKVTANSNLTYDGNRKAVVASEAPANSTVKIEYAEYGSSSYSTNAPITVGKYTARVTYTADKNYALDGNGVYTVDFNILPAEISMKDIQVKANGNLTYDGNGKDVTASEAPEYAKRTIEYAELGGSFGSAAPVNAGTYVARVTYTLNDTVNYTLVDGDGVYMVYFTIKPATVDMSGLKLTAGSYTYDGNAKAVSFNNGTAAGAVKGGDIEYAVKDSTKYSAEAPKNAGEYTARLKFVLDGSGNYVFDGDGYIYVTFTIARQNITAPSAIGSLVYTGGELSGISGYDGEKMILVSGSLSGINAGDYEVVFAPKDNYQWADGVGEKTITYTVAKAENKFSVDSIVREGWKLGETPSAVPAVTAAFGEVKIAYFTDEECTKPFNPATDYWTAGTYYMQVTVAGTDNYEKLEYVTSFVVEEADVIQPDNPGETPGDDNPGNDNPGDNNPGDDNTGDIGGNNTEVSDGVNRTTFIVVVALEAVVVVALIVTLFALARRKK